MYTRTITDKLTDLKFILSPGIYDNDCMGNFAEKNKRNVL